MKKNLAFSIMGVLLNTLFPILIFPYISRVLGAEGLGTYNYYNLAITYIALFTSFGIAIYGVREVGKYKNDTAKRTQVAVELIVLNVVNALICYILILLIGIFSSYQADLHIILLLSTVLITNAIGAEWFFVGIEYQKYILVRSFIVKLVSLLLIFLFVRSYDDLLLYIIIIVLGMALPALLNFFYLFKHIDLQGLKKLEIKRHIGPLFLIFIVEISVRYFGMADVVILGKMDSKVIVGYYSLALNVFLLISSFIRISAVTLLPRVSFYLGEKEWDKFYSLIRTTINFIFFLGVPCSAGMYVWANEIVALLGGASFVPSASVLKYFAALIIISCLLNMLVFQFLYPINRTKTITVAFAAGIILNLVLNIILIPEYSMIGTVVSSIISQCVVCILLFAMNHKYIERSIFSKDLLKYILAGVTLVAFALSTRNILNGGLILVQIIISGGLYLGTLMILKDPLLTEFFIKPLRRHGKEN